MAYIDIARSDVLLADRADWLADTDTAKKDLHLQKGTDYLDALYGTVYIGSIASSSQTELWPRTSTVDLSGKAISGIPEDLERATAEAAYLSYSGEELLPVTVSGGTTTTSTVPTGAVTEETVDVDGVKSTTKYSAGGTTTAVATSAVILADTRGIPLISRVAAYMTFLITGAVTNTSGTSNVFFNRS